MYHVRYLVIYKIIADLHRSLQIVGVCVSVSDSLLDFKKKLLASIKQQISEVYPD